MLISAEGFEFVIDKKAAMVSQTIRNMLTSPGLLFLKLERFMCCTTLLSLLSICFGVFFLIIGRIFVIEFDFWLRWVLKVWRRLDDFPLFCKVMYVLFAIKRRVLYMLIPKSRIIKIYSIWGFHIPCLCLRVCRWFFRNGARKGDFSGDKHNYSGEDLPILLLVSSIC